MLSVYMENTLNGEKKLKKNISQLTMDSHKNFFDPLFVS
jgi:hypothetical protein